MAHNDSKAPGIEITKHELILTRSSRGETGFAPAGHVHTHQWGTNKSIFHGRGMEFAESRDYQPGDDVKNIDWRVTARTGQPHTKLFQEERERPVHILLDLRSMMHFGSRVRFKSHLAADIAARLAWVGYDGGDRVGGLILTRTGIKHFKATRTRRSVLQFLEGISIETVVGIVPEQEITMAQALRRLVQSSTSGGLVFVISDFHDFDEAVERELKRLSSRSHVTNILVSDPLDTELPIAGGRISNGSAVVSLPDLGRKSLQSYADDFSTRSAKLEMLCRKTSMVFHRISTPDNPKSLLNPPRPKSRRRVA